MKKEKLNIEEIDVKKEENKNVKLAIIVICTIISIIFVSIIFYFMWLCYNISIVNVR